MKIAFPPAPPLQESLTRKVNEADVAEEAREESSTLRREGEASPADDYGQTMFILTQFGELP